MLMLLSILIPTLERRRIQFEVLFRSLSTQIRDAQLQHKVEILSELDAGELSIGAKRNLLLKRAAGEFVAFIDDDDEVSPDYLRLLCDAISRKPEADTVGFRGVITFRGRRPRQFEHSLRHPDYCSRNETYYRPPNHVNPIRRGIAIRYRFIEVSYSEDIDWALRIRNDGALRTEAFIDSTLYYYRSRRWWPYQWLLDHTEKTRHQFGIRLANRLRFRETLRSLLRSMVVPQKETFR
jgi:glycosyltransferase involved in cell wall biosynthesis